MDNVSTTERKRGDQLGVGMSEPSPAAAQKQSFVTTLFGEKSIPLPANMENSSTTERRKTKRGGQ
jgi:hypothetical protein